MVLTSRAEAFGMVLTEAIGMGVPILSTPAGALSILNDVAIQVECDPHSIAQGLRYWLNNLQERENYLHRVSQCTLPTWAMQANLFGQCIMDSINRFSLNT